MSSEDARLYRIVPIGSSSQGWAIERDGKILIAARPRPSYEERRAVFKPTGRPGPSRDPFPIVSKGGGRPTF